MAQGRQIRQGEAGNDHREFAVLSGQGIPAVEPGGARPEEGNRGGPADSAVDAAEVGGEAGHRQAMHPEV